MACVPVLSNYLINKILLVLTNQGTFTPPATLYLALFTANPTPANTGGEVSGNNYARQSVTWSGVVNGTSTANTNTITFPTATGSWGTVTYLVLFDALSGGNMLCFAPASQAITVTAGTNYALSSSALTLSLQ